MSPFSAAFRELRIFCGLRQSEFAARLGYEQSYISAIELGTKGPPTDAFIERLVERLELDEAWRGRLCSALEESQRKIVLPSEATESVYKMFNELRRQLGTLHPAQVELMQMALKLPESMSKQAVRAALPAKRKSERVKNKADTLG
ncbi:helix-turn-helix domain-containing protein [Massilia sp. CCM 8695]|uniref:Helix-turn-helix domain-containing protein n=1 Tax=Massilia frigida TaxID=2609281 RepID=A0ABX0NGU7_9BURK|nr:helix-turn-helix transcriptional regulator [Massilia frigida]NHZ82266.1 helix-turn-helix domain-containing protein [Massilia frigida]